ncbi:MAG TPA: membrane protein insertion efficiency factor YidD [Acidimicrobiales bacterium]|nr:membrane protein insertion efficiency factor YidD [Acidimicrobiales bacterium]
MNNSATTFREHLSAPSSSGPTRVLIALVRAYQSAWAGRLSPCRFFPSCSSYAIEALETHGAVRGTWLAARRLWRCRPFGPHGIDLVPEPRRARS